MSHLLRDLMREQPLSPLRERTLALATRRGDAQARDALVRASLRLVALRVRAMGFAASQVDDAMQEGVVALMAAVDRFDPDRGARLATFAWPRITGALVRWRDCEVEAVTCPAVHQRSADPEVLGLELLDDVSTVLTTLSEADARVLWLRHGLDASGRPRTWHEVGEHLGVSPSTARRRADRAMSRARRTLASMGDRAPRRVADPP